MLQIYYSPNAETKEISPREEVVSAHKHTNVGYCNILRKMFIFFQVNDNSAENREMIPLCLQRKKLECEVGLLPWSKKKKLHLLLYGFQLSSF